MKIIGIDLAGKEENPSGFCILKDNQLILKTLYSDVNVKKDKKLLFKKKDEYIEPELRPEYVEKIKWMEKDNKKPIKYDF